MSSPSSAAKRPATTSPVPSGKSLNAATEPTSSAVKRAKAAVEGEGESKMIPRCLPPRPTTMPDLTGKRALKFMCWNVNGLKSVVEKCAQDFISTVGRENPDLLFLQETKLQHGMTEKYALIVEHMTQSHFACSTGKKGYSGTAVFAKKDVKILGTSFGLGDFLKDDEGRAITVELEDFFFVGLYVANSGQGLVRLKYRIDEYDAAVRNYLAFLSKRKPVILGGDLNVAHKDLDVYNFDAPHIKKQSGCTKEERDSFTLLLESQNRVDTFRFLYPESRVFSFFSTRAGNKPLNRGLRLDYFVAPRESMEATAKVRIFDSWILDDAPEKVSDHAPVCCTVIVPMA